MSLRQAVPFLLAALLPGCATSEEVRALSRSIEEMKQSQARLEERIAALQAAAEEDRKRIDEILTRLSPPEGVRIKGVVLAADADAGIYLVSAGSKDGVTIGMEFTLYRGDKFVASVIVEKVFHDKSSVVVKKINGKPVLQSEIRPGDKAATGL